MTDGAKTIIGIRSVTKRFGSEVLAVDNVSIDIKEGEFFALLGPAAAARPPCCA